MAYIDREAADKELCGLIREYNRDARGHESSGAFEALSRVRLLPAADVVPRKQYTKLLKAAFAMHEWIFLNTDDEKTAYAECGLDDETNALLGYGGSVTLTGGADNDD